MSYTPGPWKICSDNASYLRICDQSGASIRIDFDGDGVANARLIAAAPELVEALDGFLAEFGDKAMNANIRQAHALLDRIKGEKK